MLTRAALAVVILFRCFCVCHATGNETIIPGWVSDPNGRGTFTILFSCVLTLSLCVYTAIHLNVRRYRQNEPQSWLETTKWVIFGVLAPELVVYIAWRQYISATALNRIVAGLRDKGQSSQPSLDQHLNSEESKPGSVSSNDFRLTNPWTRTHSFYANMGGFAFDLEGTCISEGDVFTAKHSLLTVTPRGMVLLAKCGFLPNISKEDILDKSKADTLSKVLSVLQALWMLIQISGRLVARLPVTLLEVNTLAHVLCALIIYLLWWDKPKLINEPTRLRGHWVPPVCAYMYMSSQISGWKSLKPGILKKTWIDPELSILAFHKSQQPECEVESKVTAQDISPDAETTNDAGELNLPGVAQTADIPRLGNLRDVDLSKSGLFLHFRSSRWALAAEAMTLHPAIASRVIPRESVIDDKKEIWLDPITEELVDDHIGNWVTESLLRDMSGNVMGMVLWSASMAYGGIHAAAWNVHFPTRTERLLWQGSSLYIASCGLLWMMINMLAHSSKFVKAYWIEVASLRAHWTSLVGLGSLATICGLTYILARA
ncbi:MAG: hypothetical protein Q9167_005846 [Letrouitia subvulpina]